MKKTTKIIMSLLTMVTLVIGPAVTAHAVPPPSSTLEMMTAEQLENRNLSVGIITWDDDLAYGYLTVEPESDNLYRVESFEVFSINDRAYASKKELAKNAAKLAFRDIRSYAQSQGWWDCKYKIKKATKSKVTATIKVEYKAVKIDEKSKELVIKQTTEKKKGKWKTTYTVNGKKVSANKLKSLFD